MKNAILYSLFCLAPFFTIHSGAQIIRTVAGGGNCDGDMATDAVLSRVSGMAMDPSGNLYIADEGDNRIRKVSPSGHITTFLGNGCSRATSSTGEPDFSDGLHISDPKVTTWEPSHLVFGPGGSIIIGENERVRKISPSGIITKIAGMSDCFSYLDSGLAVLSRADARIVIADDTGSIFITNPWNSTIIRISTAGIIQVYDTCEGHPMALATDHSNRIYYSAGNRVWRIDSVGHHTIVAGSAGSGFWGDGGPATNALMYSVGHIFIDAADNLYLSDFGNNRVRKVDNTGIITTVAGSGTSGYSGDGGAATDAAVIAWKIFVDGTGNLYLSGDKCVRKVNTSGVISTIAGRPDRAYCADAPDMAVNVQFARISDVLADGTGGFFVADETRHIVHHVDHAGHISPIAGSGQNGYSGDGGPATAAHLMKPVSVCTDLSGNLYISDRDAHVVRKVDASGIITTVAGTGLEGFPYPGDEGLATATSLLYPADIAVDKHGNLFISQPVFNMILKVGVDGIVRTFAGNSTAAPGSVTDGQPATACNIGVTDMTVDDTGNVYLGSDYAIFKVDTNGIIHDIRGGNAPGGNSCTPSSAPLSPDHGVNPSRIAIDKKGVIYFGSYSMGMGIKMRDTLATITRLAGICSMRGWKGDGGNATAADITEIRAISVDDSGLYFADVENNRIRYFPFSPPAGSSAITTVNGNTKHSVSAHPNPFTNSITIDDIAVAGKAAIYDEQGKKLTPYWSLEQGKPQTYPVPEGLPGGIYFLVVFDARGNGVDIVTLQKK